ncbi:MAG: ATP-dependent Clp protease ATP-binding subunit [Lachnospiraceae bacterium]|nr:ATP-dependent Clp protease ATP-binding subunit [Lachnospiraceae bacterium]
MQFLGQAFQNAAGQKDPKSQDEQFTLKITDTLAEVLKEADEVREELKANAIGTEHLLAAMIRVKKGLAYAVLESQGVDEETYFSTLGKLLRSNYPVMEFTGGHYTPIAVKALKSAEAKAVEAGVDTVGTEHLLLAILDNESASGSRILQALRVSPEELKENVLSFLRHGTYKSGGKETVTRNQSRTPVLDTYSRDLTEMAADGKLDPVVGRDHEIMRVIQILSRRTKNNPCLIGEPGVGKTAVVEGLASRIVSGDVPEAIQGKRIVSLDISSMVAGSKYRGEFEERIKNVIREITEDHSIILFIDEIHTIIGAGEAEGALDAANIIKPSLARGELQLIGATTITEYRKHIEKDAALERRFQPVMVQEPTIEESVEILKGLRPAYEAHHHVVITDEALKDAVRLAERYINDRFLPDKAIDLMDEAASKVRLNSFQRPSELKKLEDSLKKLEADKEDAVMKQDFERAFAIRKEEEKTEKKLEKARQKWEASEEESRPKVTEHDIQSVVSTWTGIPVESIRETEANRLTHLEDILKKRIVSQQEAVTEIAKAIRRGRVGLKDPKRPIGSFLFLGPTGVGKTELSKALSEAIFGSDDNMIRIDMSEYMEKHSVSKLIGSPPGYVGFEEGGQLSEKVRRNPYSVLLFDEIEKAHPDVFNILLQVMDDGRITDSQGRMVDFKNTVIIMTSNLGAESIVTPKTLGFGSKPDEERDYETMKKRVLEDVRKTFKPEFLNRIDGILVFHPLNKENMHEIVKIMLNELAKRSKEETGITLKFTAKAREFLVDKGYDPKYGARPLRRTIQNLVEDELSEKILSGEFENGDTVTIAKDKDHLTFTKQEK